MATVVAVWLGTGCADEALQQPERVSAFSVEYQETASVPGYAMPSCGADVRDSHQCALNEQAYDIYFEVQDPTLASWLEYLRQCRDWEEQHDERYPTTPQLQLVAKFTADSRPEVDTLEGRSTIFVDDVYSERLWTDRFTVRAYFSSHPMVSAALTPTADRMCLSLTAPLDCSYRTDTISLRSARIEIPDPLVEDPSPADRFVFPAVQNIDPTTVTVFYAARR